MLGPSAALLRNSALKIEKKATKAISICSELLVFIQICPIFRLFKLAFIDILVPRLDRKSD
ncbi:unnamed protein product, partial [Vitis vinifera]